MFIFFFTLFCLNENSLENFKIDILYVNHLKSLLIYISTYNSQKSGKITRAIDLQKYILLYKLYTVFVTVFTSDTDHVIIIEWSVSLILINYNTSLSVAIYDAWYI
jgi:hypothetical protein